MMNVSQLMTHHQANNVGQSIAQRELLQSRATPTPMQTWPRDCKYLDHLTMNVEQLEYCLENDSQYCGDHDERGVALITKNGDVQSVQQGQSVVPGDGADDVRQSADNSQLTFVTVRQRRIFEKRESRSRFDLTKQEWNAILTSGKVLPSFVEALHTNSFAHSLSISYQDATDQREPVEEAIHIILKVGSHKGNNFALYIRQSIITERVFALFVGSEYIEPLSLARRLKNFYSLDAFQVVLITQELALDHLKTLVWERDVVTQEMESRTGYSIIQHADRKPLPSDQITFSPDLHVALTHHHSILWACDRFYDLALYVAIQLPKYQHLLRPRPDTADARVAIVNLQNALDIKAVLFRGEALNMRRLTTRLEEQQHVTRTLTTERDSRATLEMGRAAKVDTELMKAISLTTMIFLPATFTATFFSMVFFHVGDEAEINLKVSGWLWLYFAVTVPTTILMLAIYQQWKNPVTSMFDLMSGSTSKLRSANSTSSPCGL